MRCTVCEKQKEEYLCPECGFDESCNYELFRTFAPLSDRTNSISGYREMNNIPSYNRFSGKSRIICPVCGFDESCDCESFGTFALPGGTLKSNSGRRKAGLESYAEYQSLLTAFENLKAENKMQRNGEFIPRQEEKDYHSILKSDSISIGDVIQFGSYSQDANGGIRPIEWIVLDKRDSNALLISKYVLDCRQYNNRFKFFSGVTWETCSLRKWLNFNFYNTAFKYSEQSRICTSIVTADRNPEHNTLPGNNTIDNVFILSIDEANRYFGSDEARKCVPTEYAKLHGVFTNSGYTTSDGEETCYWWLRTPGSNSSNAANVGRDGFVGSHGNGVDYNKSGVRPAMWINLE